MTQKGFLLESIFFFSSLRSSSKRNVIVMANVLCEQMATVRLEVYDTFGLHCQKSISCFCRQSFSLARFVPAQ